MDRVTKSTYLLLVNSLDTIDDYAMIYVHDLVRLHGMPLSLISDRDTQFMS